MAKIPELINEMPEPSHRKIQVRTCDECPYKDRTGALGPRSEYGNLICRKAARMLPAYKVEVTTKIELLTGEVYVVNNPSYRQVPKVIPKWCPLPKD